MNAIQSGWGFPLETYVYGPQVAEFNKTNFESIYSVEEIDYEIVGKLKATEFIAILDCIKNSRTVKRKSEGHWALKSKNIEFVGWTKSKGQRFVHMQLNSKPPF